MGTGTGAGTGRGGWERDECATKPEELWTRFEKRGRLGLKKKINKTRKYWFSSCQP